MSAPRSGLSKAPPGLLGQTIDQRYRVEALLGRGGMGLVYRVTHTRLNKPLAIKVLRRENTNDEEVLARFRREAESASAIGNQHIVDVSDFGTLEDGSTYFVMECLEGMDLIDALDAAGRMPQERALHIGTQICRALAAAHEAGIVHRDLKPENVFLTEREGVQDFVKVLDFGIAKVANGPKRLTKDGEVLGTPHYMSPEQCEGEGIDHRTDIYALGVLLYEMLTGHVPHDADTMMGILTKQMYEDPVRPTVRVPQIPRALERVVMRCLDKNPERRYQTMRELEEELTRMRAGEPLSGPDTLTMAPGELPGSARRPVSPLILGGLALCVIVFFGALATGVMKRPPRAEPSAIVQSPAVAPKPQPAAQPVEKLPAVPDEAPRAVAPEPVPTTAKPRPTKRASSSGKTKREPAYRGQPVILDPWK